MDEPSSITLLTDQDRQLSEIIAESEAGCAEPRQLQALARLFAGAHVRVPDRIAVPQLWGSTVYMYLLVKSRYIPRGLAGLGISQSWWERSAFWPSWCSPV